MGFKRPIEDEKFNEFPLKHTKQINLGNDLTSFSQNFPELEETQKTNDPGEDKDLYFKIQYDDESDISKDVAGSGPTYFSPFSPEYADIHFPSRLVPQFKDTYSSLLEGLPRKQVPIGADYQAILPVWDPQVAVNDGDGKLMGDCVHLLPDLELSAQINDVSDHGRTGCTCPDEGSIRCVQQHVKEAREASRVTLGDEKFKKLGFCDMGEDVSEKWSEEEERIFHEVVYTEDVSHGKNFWDNLSTVFPSRKKSEIVSYYFNVFVLRRRSVQNRSKFLDIDSDDDDWDETYWFPLGFKQEGADSETDSPFPVGEGDHPVNDDMDKDDGKRYFKVGFDKNGVGSTNVQGEPCNGKMWDDNFPMSPLKIFDLPPTGNMMEDIFGPCPKNNGSIL